MSSEFAAPFVLLSIDALTNFTVDAFLPPLLLLPLPSPLHVRRQLVRPKPACAQGGEPQRALSSTKELLLPLSPFWSSPFLLIPYVRVESSCSDSRLESIDSFSHRRLFVPSCLTTHTDQDPHELGARGVNNPAFEFAFRSVPSPLIPPILNLFPTRTRG
jgi:hypothetical protein